MKILVTPRSVTRTQGHPSLKPIGDAGYDVVFSTPGELPGEDELLKLLPGCTGYLAGVEKISAKLLDAAPGLRVISRNGTGVDSIDLEAAERNGIEVCRALGANARGVAELTLGLILGLIRSIPYSDAAMKTRGWARREGVELAGRTLGLIGCGVVGKCVARFALAFDMNVAAFDPYPDLNFQPGARFSRVDMAGLLAQSDIISLHCPPTADGKPLVDATMISRMKDGVYLVNTARSSLLDQDAALCALASGKISGIAVDAFASEPPADWRLTLDPRVIATPHIGGYTGESIERAMSVAVYNLLHALATSNDAAKARKAHV
ncbi:MAG: phosphoglycerate dehydrogenase [Betaproteobacteria bacterium]|nr:phosphoglycerate dehydrogenase [Betaproteobacteria bacterium]